MHGVWTVGELRVNRCRFDEPSRDTYTLGSPKGPWTARHISASIRTVRVRRCRRRTLPAGERVRLQEQPRQYSRHSSNVRARLSPERTSRAAVEDRHFRFRTRAQHRHQEGRRALGDSAKIPRSLRHWRGAVLVHCAHHPTRTPPRTGGSERNAPTLQPRRLRAAVDLLDVDVAVGHGCGRGIWFANRSVEDYGTPGSEARAKPLHLAVMPLQILAGSGGPDSSYLGVGVADAITTRLAGTRRIGLRPTAAVLQYKDTQPNPVVVAEALGVHYLLQGTVRRAGDTMRDARSNAASASNRRLATNLR